MHFVTLLEEMPVQETLDGIAELRGGPGGLRPGGIFDQHGREPELLPDDRRWPAAAEGRLDARELASA